MTFEGLTALSVEMKTNVSTPLAEAARAALRVPRMLFSTASRGAAPGSGHACARRHGRRSAGGRGANSSSNPASSRMSPTTWVRGRSGWLSPRSSPRSRAGSRSGPGRPAGPGAKRASCRHSSEPMDPPAPVTRTVRPRTRPAIPSKSMTTGSRPSKSSIRTSRIWPSAPLPAMKSEIAGTVRHSTPASWQNSTTCRISRDGAVGAAMST